jgi:hypothetical protein
MANDLPILSEYAVGSTIYELSKKYREAKNQQTYKKLKNEQLGILDLIIIIPGNSVFVCLFITLLVLSLDLPTLSNVILYLSAILFVSAMNFRSQQRVKEQITALLPTRRTTKEQALVDDPLAQLARAVVDLKNDYNQDCIEWNNHAMDVNAWLEMVKIGRVKIEDIPINRDGEAVTLVRLRQRYRILQAETEWLKRMLLKREQKNASDTTCLGHFSQAALEEASRNAVARIRAEIEISETLEGKQEPLPRATAEAKLEHLDREPPHMPKKIAAQLASRKRYAH